MSKNGIVILIIAALVFLATGFFLGQAATALINTPGSEGDPLVSQSYVEKLVGERTAAIQTQLEELQGEINELKSGAVNTAAGDNNTPEPPDSGGESTPPAVSGAKKVEITANSVNLREKPSTSSAKVGSASKGDKFNYLGSEGDWYQITLNDGSTAWVASFLAKLLQ